MSVARVWEGGSQRPQTAQSRDASLEQRLRDFLRSGGDWERSRTSIPGVFVVKLPGRGPRGAELTLEINPVDGQGQPRKKMRLYGPSGSSSQSARAPCNTTA
jgi:hypothetical protein